MQKITHLIAREKMHLLKSMGSRGVAIYNCDQKELNVESRDISCRKFTFGKSKAATLQILGSSKFLYQGTVYDLKLKNIYPPSYCYTFAAALSVACALGIPPSISAAALSTYKSPAGRMRIFNGLGGSTLLDGTYNASPQAVQDSLILLKKLAGKKKKIAVIGDMNELGATTKTLHKELAIDLAQSVDETILYGKHTLAYCLPYLQRKGHKVTHFEQMADLIRYLTKQLKPNTHVLFKGSQNNIMLERAVAPCLADQNDEKYLCRRGPFWDKLRAKLP